MEQSIVGVVVEVEMGRVQGMGEIELDYEEGVLVVKVDGKYYLEEVIKYQLQDEGQKAKWDNKNKKLKVSFKVDNQKT